MTFRVFAPIGAALSMVAAPAAAEGLFNLEPSPSGFYVSAFGGASFLEDSRFNGVSDPAAGVPGPTGVAGVPLNVDIDYDGGYTVGGAVGYRLPFRFFSVLHPRVEVEVSYLEENVNAGSFNGGSQIFGGEQEALFVYFNSYADIKLSQDQKFVPYFGGGLGAAFVDSSVTYFPPTAPGPTFAVADEDTAFAGHVAAGASYALTSNLELYSEGRYFRVSNVGLERRFIGGGADLFNGNVEDDLDGFTVTGGLRVKF